MDMVQIDLNDLPHLYNNLNRKINNLDEKLRSSVSIDDEFKDHLKQLYEFVLQVLDFVHEYDYAPTHPYNGFRTFKKIVSIYFREFGSILYLPSDSNTVNSTKLPIDVIKAYVDCLSILIHQVEALKMIRELKDVKPDDNEARLKIELKILSHEIKLDRKQIEEFHSHLISGFWLPKSVRNIFGRGTKIASALMFYPLKQSIPAMFNMKKLTKLSVDRALHGSFSEVDRESKVWSFLLSSKAPPHSTMKVFTLENRQNNWIINKKMIFIENQNETKKDNKPVRLVIVVPKCRMNDKIIYHIHGGAWVFGKPEIYFNNFKEWIQEIGSTIVSIDYSLAPHAIYPVALQEILDTYIWLDDLRKNNETHPDLGFIPTDILVTGDSAGGNLTLSLAIALAEIKKISHDSVKLPKAFAPLYPAASPGLPYCGPSHVLFDIVLSGPSRLKWPSVYILDDVADPKVSYLNGKNNPWFKDEEKSSAVYVRINGNRQDDPILHIYTYNSYSLLDEVPLYIQAAEFDPLLDDAVEVAKLWKGKVVFDVMPNVIHGFSLFKERSPECKEADQFVVKRMKEALDA